MEEIQEIVRTKAIKIKSDKGCFLKKKIAYNLKKIIDDEHKSLTQPFKFVPSL